MCGGDTQLEYRGWMEQSDRARTFLEWQGAITFGGGSQVWSDAWAGPWRITVWRLTSWSSGGGGGWALRPTLPWLATEKAARHSGLPVHGGRRRGQRVTEACDSSSGGRRRQQRALRWPLAFYLRGFIRFYSWGYSWGAPQHLRKGGARVV